MQQPRQHKHSPQPTPSFTGAELRALFRAVVDGTPGPVSDAELRSFVAWATLARVTSVLLDMTIHGETVVRWGRDDWLFTLREGRAS
jgi:hypothetical protein